MGKVYSQCSLSDVFIKCVTNFMAKPYIDKLREVIDSLKTSGIV